MNKGLVLVKILGTRCLYAYPCCTVCHKKVRKFHEQDGRLWCSTCLKSYTQKNLHYRYHVNLTVSDCSGIARVTVFGKSLEAFFGLTATEFCRYVMKCGRTKSHEGLDVHKMVHIAMEKCFVGEMVYLAFRLTNTTKNTSQIQANVLPASKATNFNTYCELPELLANGICKIQNEKKHRSIADFFKEYLGHFEKSVLSGSGRIAGNFTGKDCSHSIANDENRIISMNETDCGIHDVMSPRHLLGVSSNRNNFVLSLMPSGNESNSNVDVLKLNLSSDFETIQRSVCFQHDRVEGNSSESGESGILCNENLTINDLQQSFCCTSNTNDPCMWTSIRKDSPNSESRPENLTAKGTLFSTSVSENIKPVRFSTNAVDVCLKSGIQSNVEKTGGSSCETACDSEGSLGRDKDPEIPAYNEFDMVFDSPTSEDLDAFLADISFTWLPELAEQNDGNQNQSCYKADERCPRETGETHTTSDSNIVCCDNQPQTCLTSTPSLANRKTSDVGGAFSSTFSPIYSEFISTSSERHSFVAYDDSHAMFPTAGKQQSKFGLSSTLISRNTTCQKSSSKVSSRTKGKKRSKNLLKCILSSEKSSWCSNNSQLKNALDAPQESLSNSPDPCTRLVRDTTPREKWTEHSLLLFEDASPLSGSKEENIKSNHTNSDGACLKNNIFDEKLSSPCGSPLLFSP